MQHPFDPAPKIAARVERRMAEVGEALFSAIFEANRKMSRWWANAVEELNETRIEVITEVAEATTILPHASVRVGVVARS